MRHHRALRRGVGGENLRCGRPSCASALGLPFLGQRVAQSGVIYFAAEAGTGVIPRMRAAEDALAGEIEAENHARAARGEPPLRRAPLIVVTEPLNLGP